MPSQPFGCKVKDQNRTKAQLVEELQRLREQSPEFERLKPLISGSSADAPHADRSDTLRAVRVPGQFREVFTKAEKYVKQYFTSTSANPEHGTIEISGERYILVRAASMSTEFFDLVTSLYEDRGKEEASCSTLPMPWERPMLVNSRAE
jgi:hypothetical protein